MTCSVERALVGNFACTVDIHNGVSGHVETVCLLSNTQSKKKESYSDTDTDRRRADNYK